VANVKPLNLKRQRAIPAARRATEIKTGDLQAEVVLDVGIFHVEQSFTYAIPEQHKEHISVGSVVQVPFRNIKHTGVVVSVDPRSKRDLFSIDSLLASNVFSVQQIQFFEKVAERYLSNFSQMLIKAVPPFSKTRQITAKPFSNRTAKRNSTLRSFMPIGIGSSSYQVMVQKLEEAHTKGGSTLLLFPTIKAL
jgi:primosomal protein N'